MECRAESEAGTVEEDAMSAAPAVDLDYIGREARSRISFAEKHAEKFLALSKSAGVLLIDAKARLGHGNWYPWLEKHGICREKARKCMELVKNPEQAERRMEAHAEAQQRYREKSQSRDCDSPPAPTADPDKVVPLSLSRVVRKLTPEQQDDVRAYIKSKFGI
jgi:hypothetical protein